MCSTLSCAGIDHSLIKIAYVRFVHVNETAEQLLPLQLDHGVRNRQGTLILKTVPLRPTNFITLQLARRVVLPVKRGQFLRLNSGHVALDELRDLFGSRPSTFTSFRSGWRLRLRAVPWQFLRFASISSAARFHRDSSRWDTLGWLWTSKVTARLSTTSKVTAFRFRSLCRWTAAGRANLSSRPRCEMTLGNCVRGI